jgi:hypothetical protein
MRVVLVMVEGKVGGRKKRWEGEGGSAAFLTAFRHAVERSFAQGDTPYSPWQKTERNGHQIWLQNGLRTTTAWKLTIFLTKMNEKKLFQRETVTWAHGRF